jgi:TM2 domain-containing membrane protein YozV
LEDYLVQSLAGLTEPQRILFMQEFNAVRKDVSVAILLALLGGGFGLHQFYLRRNGLGILYLLFFWTVIPHIIAILECFVMSGRVRWYNQQRAFEIAQKVRQLNSSGVVR